MKQTPSDPHRYTQPELRDRIKKQVTEGDKGGQPGQWSARKAQLVAREYEAAGGGYRAKKSTPQKSLEAWGEEKWRTEDGGKAEREGGTTRYLPDQAWEKLSPAERAATNRKKREGSRQGKQFVANTGPAAEARKQAAVSKTAARSGKPAVKKTPGRAGKTTAARPKAGAAKAAAKKTPQPKTAGKKASPQKTAKKAAPKTASKTASKTAKKTAQKTAPKTANKTAARNTA